MTQPTHFGRYRVQKVLGQGAMGLVYLADDPVISRQVAIKVIKPPPGGNTEEYSRALTGSFDQPGLFRTPTS